jgi:hypothetical protein
MHPPLELRPRQRRHSVRRQARLDAETHAKLEGLVTALHLKRSAILRYIMERGRAHTHGWTVEPAIPDRPHLVHPLVEPDPLHRCRMLQMPTASRWLRGCGIRSVRCP